MTDKIDLSNYPYQEHYDRLCAIIIKDSPLQETTDSDDEIDPEIFERHLQNQEDEIRDKKKKYINKLITDADKKEKELCIIYGYIDFIKNKLENWQ